MKSLLAKPLLHFLLLGGMLFAIDSSLPSDLAFGRETILVAEADVQQIRDQWLRSTGRPPTPPQLAASLDQWLGDEALFREALRRGLDVRDPVVQQRLLRNLRFADPGRADDPGELLAAARALGMVRQDLVIRRRLVQRMEQALTEDLRVGDDELRAYVEAHPQRYSTPVRYVLDHVFVSGQGEAAQRRAEGLLARLQAGDPAAAGDGDSFALALGGAQSQRELSQRIGAGFASGVVRATPETWSGPLPSAYGWHLVRVTRVIPAEPADLEQVRAAAVRALHAERRDEHLRAERARLLARYRVELPAGVVMEARR